MTKLTGHKKQAYLNQTSAKYLYWLKDAGVSLPVSSQFMNFACTGMHLYVPDKRDTFTKMTFTV